MSSIHFSLGHCFVNQTEVGAMQIYSPRCCHEEITFRSFTLGYNCGRAGRVSVNDSISSKLRCTSCFPPETSEPISCFIFFVNRNENGFLSKPIFCFAPEYAVRNPDEAKRCMFTT